MKDLLYIVIGLIAAGVAVWQMMAYLGQGRTASTHMPLIIAIICAVVALACGGLFLSGRVNKTEDIHITE